MMLYQTKEAYKNPKDGNYHFKATLQGWIEEMNQFVDGREYLRALVDLKKEKPELKVLLYDFQKNLNYCQLLLVHHSLGWTQKHWSI